MLSRSRIRRRERSQEGVAFCHLIVFQLLWIREVGGRSHSLVDLSHRLLEETRGDTVHLRNQETITSRYIMMTVRLMTATIQPLNGHRLWDLQYVRHLSPRCRASRVLGRRAIRWGKVRRPSSRLPGDVFDRLRPGMQCESPRPQCNKHPSGQDDLAYR